MSGPTTTPFGDTRASGPRSRLWKLGTGSASRRVGCGTRTAVAGGPTATPTRSTSTNEPEASVASATHHGVGERTARHRHGLLRRRGESLGGQGHGDAEAN